MKRNILSTLIVFILFILSMPSAVLAREIAPIVSTDWLSANLNNPKLIILDIRRVEDYRDGHIPGAMSAFYGAWVYMKDGLFGSLPDKDDIDDTIDYMGIHYDNWVVVTGCMDTPRLSYQSARVACTLQYAGIENVALLDGGINKWIAEKKPLSDRIEKRKAGNFKGKYTGEVFASMDYLKERAGKLILLDVREREYFTGEKKMDCVAKAGHIPGAVNLPTSCAFNADKTFKTREELAALAETAAGKDRSAAIVTYCDTGQCCPIWSYLMKQVLGYTNVRLYVGAMQEWTQDPQAPVTVNGKAQQTPGTGNK
jgi:thiosulfate/3-mercaptopyruvate sulfurtransferase